MRALAWGKKKTHVNHLSVHPVQCVFVVIISTEKLGISVMECISAIDTPSLNFTGIFQV